MNIIEALSENTQLFDTENSKKYKALLDELNTLLNTMCNAYSQITDYINNEEMHKIISLAKGLNDYMFYAESLNLSGLLEKLKVSEEDIINQFHDTKYMILDKLSLVENPTEAIVCTHRIRGKSFVKCEDNDMLVIIGEHHNIIHDLKDIIEELRIEGIFDKIEPEEISFNVNIINDNIGKSREIAYNLLKDKPSKLDKVNEIIDRLEASSIKVVSFYAYKDRLEQICDPKQIESQEFEISKEYIPLKKWVQNTLNIELKDICEKVVDEEIYDPLGVFVEEDNIESIQNQHNNFDTQNIVEEINTPETTQDNYDALDSNEYYIKPTTKFVDSIIFDTPQEKEKPAPKISSFEKAQMNILSQKKHEPEMEEENNIIEEPAEEVEDYYPNIQEESFELENKNEDPLDSEIDSHIDHLKGLMNHLNASIESKNNNNDDDDNNGFQYDEI